MKETGPLAWPPIPPFMALPFSPQMTEVAADSSAVFADDSGVLYTVKYAVDAVWDIDDKTGEELPGSCLRTPENVIVFE